MAKFQSTLRFDSVSIVQLNLTGAGRYPSLVSPDKDVLNTLERNMFCKSRQENASREGEFMVF